jgi:MraZ protein
MDSKGRVVIPSKFRRELQQGCVVTKGQDNCLQILTKKSWTSLSEEMVDLPVTEKSSRQLRRAIFSGAVDSKLDSAGRIPIPENLRKYSQIDINDEVTVTGIGNAIEIWSSKMWKKVQNDADNEFANINEVKG